jgi:hypothetical protein
VIHLLRILINGMSFVFALFSIVYMLMAFHIGTIAVPIDPVEAVIYSTINAFASGIFSRLIKEIE